MKFKFNIRREVKIVLSLAVLMFLIAFSERKQSHVAIKDVHVEIENIHENHFIDEDDVMRLMQLKHENLRGADIEHMRFRELERKIKRNKFVHDADLYSDLKGNMVVEVQLRRPLARLVRNDGPDGYIAEDGTIMPVSEKFTARVVLISGSFAKNILTKENLNELEEGRQLMEMLERMREDDFLRAQVAQLDIDTQANITLYPQVGGQMVEFGKPEDIEVKFKKLKIFYKHILPQKGWNRYSRVNLEYEGQIVAE